METKYGNIPGEQIKNHKELLHKYVFSLLGMREGTRYPYNQEYFSKYFDSILLELTGYNEIFNKQEIMIDIISTLEGARIEALKDDYNHTLYRKSILDVMSMINKLRED